MYGDHEYWEARYHQGVVGHCQQKGVLSNEWYLQYPAIQSLLHKYVQPDDRILIPGCGLSLLGEEMAADGYTSLLAVDYSPKCIQTMQDLGSKETKCARAVTYAVMDVTQLNLEGSSADAVVDKATLDCLMNCTDWQAHVGAMLKEVARVLKPGGKFVCISHSEPEDREHILMHAELPWKILEHVELVKHKAIFHAYIMQKLQ